MRSVFEGVKPWQICVVLLLFIFLVAGVAYAVQSGLAGGDEGEAVSGGKRKKEKGVVKVGGDFGGGGRASPRGWPDDEQWDAEDEEWDEWDDDYREYN